MANAIHYVLMTLESLVRSDTFSTQIAREIRLHLARLGQNQAALARALGVPPMWVSDRMSGKVQIGTNELPRIAEALGIGVIDLLPRAERERELTHWYPPAVGEPRHAAWAKHPIIAAAVPIPLSRSPGLRRTAPTGA